MIDTVAVAEWRAAGRHFAPAVCAAVVWFLLCAIGFNLIDPYGVIDWPVVAGFNDVKPSRYANARIYKPVSFLRGDYNGIILGGSRELLGMDPHNAILSSNGRRFYNFALVEERTYEAAQIIEFAVAHRAISTVVIDLDFTRYNLDPPLLAGPQPFYPKGRSILPWALGQDALAAVSPRGLGDSFDTLLASRERRLLARRHTPGGLEENPGRSPDLQYPYEARFAFGLSRYLNVILPTVADYSATWTKRGFDHSALQKILDLAAAHDIRIVAFLAPDHALLMEAYRRRGLWPLYEQWKRELVAVFDATRSAHRGADFSLRDFGGYNSATTEPLPRGGTPEVMDYWDEVHYSVGMGDKILAVLFPSPAADTPIPPGGFGTELTSANIEAHLGAIRAGQAAYDASQADDLKWLAALDNSAMRSTARP